MTDYSSLPIPTLSPEEPPVRRNSSRFSKLGYLGIGLLANTAIWGLAVAYLNLAPRGYKSEWAVKVLDTAPRVDLSLPGAAAPTNSGKRGIAEDPRSDYVYLIQSPDLVKDAAYQVGIPAEEFGEVDITTASLSSLIEFVIEGETPELAQKKARALHVVLDQRVDGLRKQELLRREQEARTSLESARERVEVAQEQLANFQLASGLNTDSQIDDLAGGLEQMRRDYSMILAQEQGLGSRVQQLATDINESSVGAADAYRLQSDPVFQSQFEEYGNIAAAYADISSQLGPQHPQVVAKRAELEGLGSAVENRGSFLLGRPVNQATLAQLAPISNDPRVAVARGDLFREAVTSRADQSGLQSQTQTLFNQISGLENRLQQMAQAKFTADRLRRDLQAAEALFASAVTKLTLNENDIYAIYPPLQLATEPTLAEEDQYISPSPTMTIVGALAASFLVITGLLLHWANTQGREEAFETADFPFRA